MKLNKLFLGLVGISMAFASCTSDFDEINTDPNNPTPGTVDPKQQLIFIQARGITYSNTWQSQDQELISTFCEYGANDPLSASDYNIDERYISGLWNNSYTVIANANSIIRSNSDKPIYNNIVQMARVWKAYVALRLTNCVGDMPYTEAAAGIEQPKYDTQKDIYYTIFEELKDAVSKFDETASNNVGSYDLIYGGDVKKWKKFANTLRLRMAVRILNVDKEKAKAEAAAAVAAGIFTSADDAAMLDMGDDTTSQNPIYYHKNSCVISMSTAYKRLVSGIGGQAWPTAEDQAKNANITNAILAAINHPAKVDPRAPIQFEPAGQVGAIENPALMGNWDGTDPGHVASAVGAAMDNGQDVTNFAKIGPWYYNEVNRKWPLLKYSEACFLQAIAIVNGLISGDAKACYENGVRANMQQFNIPADVINAYLQSNEPNFYGTTANYSDNSGNCNTAMDKILTQKYIALFQEGSFEAWADHRQFHKPTLMPFANVAASFNRNAADVAANNPNAYIKRLFYPTDEYTVNEANVREAEKRMGGNNNTTNNVWWDVD